jgi:hypothetical protein
MNNTISAMMTKFDTMNNTLASLLRSSFEQRQDMGYDGDGESSSRGPSNNKTKRKVKLHNAKQPRAARLNEMHVSSL